MQHRWINRVRSVPKITLPTLFREERSQSSLQTESLHLESVKSKLIRAGGAVEIVSKRHGKIESEEGRTIEVDQSFLTSSSIMYDAVYIPGGARNVEKLSQEGDAIYFIREAFQHCKPIGATGSGVTVLEISGIVSDDGAGEDPAIVTENSRSPSGDFHQRFHDAIAMHRYWERAPREDLPV